MAEGMETEPQGVIRSYAQSTFVAASLALQQEDAEGAHKISTAEAVLMGLVALGMDIADWTGAGELFITDGVGLLFDLYIYMKGLPLTRFAINQGVELIPGVQEVWPGYTAGWFLTVWLDRHPSAEKAAQVISTATGRGGAKGARALAGKPSGIVRSVPGEAPTGLQPRVGTRVVTGVERGEGGEVIRHVEHGDKSWFRQQRERLRKRAGERGESASGGPTVGEEEPQEGELIPGEQTLFQTPEFQEGKVRTKPVAERQRPVSEPAPEAPIAPQKQYREEYVADLETRTPPLKEQAAVPLAASLPDITAPPRAGAPEPEEEAPTSAVAEPSPETEPTSVGRRPSPAPPRKEREPEAGDAYEDAVPLPTTTPEAPPAKSTSPAPRAPRRFPRAVPDIPAPRKETYELTEDQKKLFEPVIDALPEMPLASDTPRPAELAAPVPPQASASPPEYRRGTTSIRRPFEVLRPETKPDTPPKPAQQTDASKKEGADIRKEEENDTQLRKAA